MGEFGDDLFVNAALEGHDETRQVLHRLPGPGVEFRFMPTFPVPSRVAIFDLSGRLVRSISAPASVEPVHVTWDGLNGAGERIATGIYLVRVTSGNETRHGKVAILR